MTKLTFSVPFAVGLAVVAWAGLGFAGTGWIPLAMTAVIAAAYLLGAFELRQFRAATAGLAGALAELEQPPASLEAWLQRVPPALRHAVRLRVEGERAGLPGPALTPYLVGLLVMLGMLGTFLGMVVTFQGAVFALEGSTDLQAIRAALAEPIRGLGLAFGTSVAGVAASAMLGLMSAVSRRERLERSRELDGRIATVLAPFSLVHQRQETFRALQLQARALPEVAGALQALMERIEARGRELDEQLLQRQDRFQQQVTQAYGELARGVGASLEASLAAGAHAAGASIRPVVEDAMAQLVQASQRMQQRLDEVARNQVRELSQQFGATARSVAEGWTSALQAHARTSDATSASLQQALASFSSGFEQRSTELLAAIGERLARTQADQATAEQQRLQAWTEALQATAGGLEAQWRRSGEQSLAAQQDAALALQQAAGEIAERAGAQAGRTLEHAARLLEQSHELVHARGEAEARWLAQHGERMDQLAALWRTELAALRQEESQRGDAAVQRLGELQAAVAQHLATLGAALEAPITRLLHTASEVPRSAAGVIAQLREEMSRVAERDNLALQERTALLERLAALLDAVHQATQQQRAATEGLVDAARSALERAGERFAGALQAQAGQSAEAAAHIAGGAVEMASLAEAFAHSVQLFQASSDRTIESLQRIEASLERSTARSDEQLAYYVAQAREVIDLSIASQQGLVDGLRQLQARPDRAAALAAEER